MKMFTSYITIFFVLTSISYSINDSLPRLNSSRIDSTRIDTVIMYPYYDFIQYYDSSRIVMRFGEVYIHRQNGSITDHSLYFFDPIQHNPLINNSLIDLTNLSGSLPMRYIAGDTICYYWELHEMREYDQRSTWINIPDTIIYYLDIINTWNSHVLSTIDSLGVLPHTSLTSFLYSPLNVVVQSNDTSLIKKYILPAFGDSIKSVRVQIRPTFKGDRNRLSISRWDFLERKKITDNMLWFRAQVSEVWGHLMDSLQALSKRIGNEIINDKSYNISILSTSPTTHSVPIKFTTKGESNTTLKIFNTLGKVIAEYSVPGEIKNHEYIFNTTNIASGPYLCILMIGTAVVFSSRFSVIK